MPRVEIDNAKGLVQKTGSNIVIKNGIINEGVSAVAAKTLTVADSGKVILLGDGSGYVVKLPANAGEAGVYYEFLYVAPAADGHLITIDAQSNTNFFIGAVQVVDTDNTGDGCAIVASDGNSNSRAVIAATGAEVGTRIFCISNGTNWTLAGVVYTAQNTNPVQLLDQ